MIFTWSDVNLGFLNKSITQIIMSREYKEFVGNHLVRFLSETFPHSELLLVDSCWRNLVCNRLLKNIDWYMSGRRIRSDEGSKLFANEFICISWAIREWLIFTNYFFVLFLINFKINIFLLTKLIQFNIIMCKWCCILMVWLHLYRFGFAKCKLFVFCLFEK